MSNNRLVFEGLSALREALRTLPAHLKAEASHVVIAAANGAAADIKANYKRVSGDLVDGVVVELAHGPVSAGAIVKSKAKHAFMYEFGTQVRHTSRGARRGSMPPAPPGRAFIPVVIRKRRQMQSKLVDVLERNGLVVSGHAE